MAPKALVPVVPEWCDCNYRNRCPKKSSIFLGICRIILAVTSFIMCFIFAVNPYGVYSEQYELDNYNLSVVRGILITICVVNVFHLAAAIYLIYMAKANMNNTPQIRRWLIVDLGITGTFVLCVLILLFSLPPHRLSLILGFKLIFLSLIFCYRAGATYYVFKCNEKDRVLVHVASSDGVAPESRYENVYRV